jgi:glucose-6-phosphate 1-dehydrogenase
MVSSTEQSPPEPCIFVIFGASGDLTRRKLGPALFELARLGLMHERTVIVGSARSALTDDEFRARLRDGLQSFARTQPVDESVWDALAQRTFYQQARYGDEADTQALGARLATLDARFDTRASRVFYLAVPPDVVVPVLDALHRTGQLRRQRPREDCREGFLRVVFEKPFGHDLDSARALNLAAETALDEQQIFRMDHYLGKETVQNIGVLRFANSIFEHVWHSRAIRSVRVTVAETIGVEGRGGYFDRTGILRDILQNHVLQLLTLVAMEPPTSLDADAIRDEKAKVLRCLRPFDAAGVSRSVVRAQYGASPSQPAYRDEDGVAPDSMTETFVALRTWIDNWRWAGVPFYLTAGKRLAGRLAEVMIEFREPPRVLFAAAGDLKPNRLTIRVQPNEGVALRVCAKVPGLETRLQEVHMDFPYDSAFPATSPEAYERLLLDVMHGRSALFARRDEIELAWQFTMGILNAWQAAPAGDLPTYAPGSWGPVSSQDFFDEQADYGALLS